MRRYAIYVPLVVIVVALLATVFLPFVNQSALWLGIPSVMLWSAIGVVLLTPALALVEYTRGRRGQTDTDDTGAGTDDSEVSGK